MSLFPILGADYNDFIADLYELSRHPKFNRIFQALDAMALTYYSDAPADANSKTKFESFMYAQFFSRKFSTDLKAEIELGEQISNPVEEEKNDAEGNRRDRIGPVPWSTQPPG
jgi:hypothetical protein